MTQAYDFIWLDFPIIKRLFFLPRPFYIYHLEGWSRDPEKSRVSFSIVICAFQGDFIVSFQTGYFPIAFRVSYFVIESGLYFPTEMCVMRLNLIKKKLFVIERERGIADTRCDKHSVHVSWYTEPPSRPIQLGSDLCRWIMWEYS